MVKPPRIEDDEGRVRCRSCGEYKPPDRMKPGPRGKCLTICRTCFSRKYRGGKKRHGRGDESLNTERARWRAQRRLAANHPDEYIRLMAEAQREIEAEMVLGYQTVPEHLRRIYGTPE